MIKRDSKIDGASVFVSGLVTEMEDGRAPLPFFLFVNRSWRNFQLSSFNSADCAK